MRSVTQQQIILNAVVAQETGSPMLVESFRHILLELGASGGSVGFTVKIQGSLADECPTFSSAQSPTNPWDYVQIKDLQNNSSIDGDTGVAYVSADVRNFEINTNGLKWVNATVTAWSSGTVTLKGKGMGGDC